MKMKRIACFILTFGLLFTLASCGKVTWHKEEVEEISFYESLAEVLDLSDTEGFYKQSMKATESYSTQTITEKIYSEDNTLTNKESSSSKTTIRYDENDEVGSIVSTDRNMSSSTAGTDMEIDKYKTIYALQGRNYIRYNALAHTYVVTKPPEDEDTWIYKDRVYQETALTVKDSVEEIFGSLISYSYLADEDIGRIISYSYRFGIDLDEMYRVISYFYSNGADDRDEVFDRLDGSSRSDIRAILSNTNSNYSSDSRTTYFVDKDVYTVEYHSEQKNYLAFGAEYNITKVTDIAVQVKVKDEKITMVRTVKTVTTCEYAEYDEIITTKTERSIDIKFSDNVSVKEPDRSKYVDFTPKNDE